MKRYMKTFLLVISVLLVVLFFTIGCSEETTDPGSSSEGTEEIEDTEVIELKVAYHWPAGSIDSNSFEYFADLVYEGTDGKVKLNLFPSDSLVPVSQMYEAIMDGITDIGYGNSANVSTRVRDFILLDILGSYDIHDYLNVSKEIEPILQEIYEEHGFVYLWGQNPSETVIASTRPILKVSDLDGLRVRDPGPWFGKALEICGSVPTTLPPGEVTVALERGTIDAVYSAFIFMDSYKVYEQAKHFTWISCQALWSHLFMNMDSWNKLTEEQQQIIREAGRKAQEQNVEAVIQFKEAFIEKTEAEGVTHYVMSDEERGKLLAVTPAIYEEVKPLLSPLGNQLFDKLESLR